MINQPIYKDLMKIQYYFIFVVFIFYEFFNGLYNPTYDLNKNPSGPYGNIWILFLITMGLALFQTHQIKKEQVIQFYGSLPIRRNTILYSNYFAGITILLLGYFVRSCMIIIRNWNNGIILFNLTLFLIASGVTMILIYSFFFFLGIVHNKDWGVLVAILLLGCFCVVSFFLVKENQNQSFNIALHSYNILQERFRPLIYIDFYQEGLRSGSYGDFVVLYNKIYWIHTCVYSMCIMLLFVLIGWVYKKKDDSNKKSLFCCSIPEWAWILLGAFLGYTLMGTCFIVFGFLFNIIQSFIDRYIFDFYRSNLIGLIANAGIMFGMLFSYILLKKRKKVSR